MLGNILGNPMNSMINMFLKTKGISFVNEKITRYGKVEDLAKDKSGYHASVRLLGYDSVIEVTMDRLEFDEGCARVKLGTFHASELWLEHLLEDHAEGREIPIPESVRPMIRPFAKYA